MKTIIKNLRFKIIVPFLLLIFMLLLALTIFSIEGYSLPLLLVTVVGVLATVGLGLALAQQIDQRISRIIAAAEQVTQGDFSVRVEDGGHDEIGHFVRVFNQMVSNLDTLHRRADRLSRTMSPQVRLWLSEKGLEFRGITQEVSVLFVDIRDFTHITEISSTEQVVFFLNDFYTTIANQVHASGGIIGKYGGDSIMAFFGAPRPEPPSKSATSALLTALALQEALADMSQRWAILGLPPIRVGIGISTGSVVAGPIGSEQQFEYTVIGDAVNLAARLQELTRNVPEFSTILSSDVYFNLEERIRGQIPVITWSRFQRMTPDDRRRRLFQLVDFGEVLVRGKRGRVYVYGVPEW
ncbi:MAG: hypothetical protein Kow0031_08890 [Anaerolineae bacterium]